MSYGCLRCSPQPANSRDLERWRQEHVRHGKPATRPGLSSAVLAGIVIAAVFLVQLHWTRAEPGRGADTSSPSRADASGPDKAAKPADPVSDTKPAAKSAQVKPWVPLSRRTTFFTQPLDPQGYVDYAAAITEELGKGITPDNNAFVLLLRALGPRPSDTVRFPEAMFRRLGMEPLPDQGDYFISLEHYLRDTVGLKNKEALIQVLEQEQIARQRPWKAQEFPHLAAWLKVNEKPLALVAQAVQRPHYFRPWVRSGDEKKHVPLMQQSLPELGPIRALAQALLARAMLRTGQADYDSAWKDLLTVLRLSRRLGRSHCVEALTGLALESSALYGLPAYLEQARLRPEDWQGRLRDLQKLPPRTSLAEIVHLGERSLALDFCQELHRQGCELDGQDSSTFAAIYWQIQRAGFPWQRVLKELNYWYDQFAQALRQPDRTQRLRALASVENELHKTLEDTAETGLGRLLGAVIPQADPNLGERFSATLAALLFSSLQRVATAYDRVEQLHQLAQLAIALQIYRVENGEFPPRLQDLVPKYLPEVPNDVFSAQALVYRRTDRGYLLYSVGPNGKDEGGRTDQDKPRGDDLRIQLPAPPPNVRPIHLP